MKLRTQCQQKGCGCFQAAFHLLNSFGIEPSIDEDERSPFFEFRPPPYWSLLKRRRFSRTINQGCRFHPFQRACECCGSYLSTLKFCYCRACKQQSIVCIECIEADVPSPCVHCRTRNLIPSNVFSEPE